MDKLYQAYVYENEKRVKVNNCYVTKTGKIYSVMANGETKQRINNDTRPYVFTYTNQYGYRKVEELMVATFFDSDNLGYEYKISKRVRFIYLDGDTHNNSIKNMRLCSIWQYIKWAAKANINVVYSDENKREIYEKFVKENMALYKFAYVYGIRYPTLQLIVKQMRARG